MLSSVKTKVVFLAPLIESERKRERAVSKQEGFSVNMRKMSAAVLNLGFELVGETQTDVNETVREARTRWSDKR